MSCFLYCPVNCVANTHQSTWICGRPRRGNTLHTHWILTWSFWKKSTTNFYRKKKYVNETAIANCFWHAGFGVPLQVPVVSKVKVTDNAEFQRAAALFLSLAHQQLTLTLLMTTLPHKFWNCLSKSKRRIRRGSWRRGGGSERANFEGSWCSFRSCATFDSVCLIATKHPCLTSLINFTESFKTLSRQAKDKQLWHVFFVKAVFCIWF